MVKKPIKQSKDPVSDYGENVVRTDFIPVDETDLAGAVDVPVRERISEKIESKGKIKKSFAKNSFKKKANKPEKSFYKNSWVEKFKIPGNKKLIPTGPVLIITEKPQACEKIASALADNGKLSKNLSSGVYYYELRYKSEEIIVACAVGHLFTLAQIVPGGGWPVYDIKWAPNFLVKKHDFSKRYYDVLAKLCKRASKIIIATDYDVEGEVIGMNIVRYLCNQEDAERMKFSTLTANEIKDSYENKSHTLNWGQGIAGETRHYLDWIYGINLSRAMMDSVKSVGRFRVMSIGRVQGPALNLIVKKEREIQAFKSQKYWQVFLDVTDGKNTIEVAYIKDIVKESDTEKFKVLDGKKGTAVIEKSRQNISPPAPFDLTTLQTEAYKFFRITPSQTLQLAQSLYLAGLISYPRTSSQKLPKEIGYTSIVKRVAEKFHCEKLIKRVAPIEGKKTDPAHPAIYPTGEFQALEEDERRIFELIAKRFLSCFCEDAVIDDKKINVLVENLKFYAKGMSIAERGWMDVYPTTLQEKELPDMGEKIIVKKVSIEEKFTQPPKRYSPASLVSELEKRNLGTKATRASITETLYDRKYIKERSIEATSLGISLISTLEVNCPFIIDEKLTREIEQKLDNLQKAKNPNEKENQILKETKELMNKISETLKKNKEKIGADLVNATDRLFEEEKKQNELNECPVCKKGKLTIKYSKRFNRYFVACNAYPECKTTFNVPPNSLIKPADKTCEHCSFPMLISIRKAKRPWIFCFNPECPSRKQGKENSSS
ncbi:DNA topoisomerase I [Candidatus Pacearchaeota archaeon]|nr:DNA topoisomerase I [Candidatus Pacearchaeota archaeon]